MGSGAIPLRPAWHRSQGLVPRPDRGQSLPMGPWASCVVTASILSVKRGACGGQGVCVGGLGTTRGVLHPPWPQKPVTRSLRCCKRRATCQGRAEGTWGTASEGARCRLSRDTVVRVTGKEKEQEKVLPWE